MLFVTKTYVTKNRYDNPLTTEASIREKRPYERNRLYDKKPRSKPSTTKKTLQQNLALITLKTNFHYDQNRDKTFYDKISLSTPKTCYDKPQLR